MTGGDFLPECFSEAFRMWSPEELIYKVISERLGGDWWISVTWKDERADKVGAAVRGAQKQVLEAFSTGALRSYVHRVGTDLFYLIPANVWAANQTLIRFIKLMCGGAASRPQRSPTYSVQPSSRRWAKSAPGPQ